MNLASFLEDVTCLSIYLLKDSNWTSGNAIEVAACACEEVENPDVIISMAHNECRQPLFEIILEDFQLEYCFLIKRMVM